MQSLRILLVCAFSSIGWAFLTDPKLFEQNPELCSKLNSSMFEKIVGIVDGPDYTEYKEIIIMTDLDLDIPFPEDPTEKPTNKDQIKVEEYHFYDGLSYVYIEGKRCKYKLNPETKKYESFKCWNKPSLCQGSLRACLENDDEEFLCFDEKSGEGKRTNVESSDQILPNLDGKKMLESIDFVLYRIAKNGKTEIEDERSVWYCAKGSKPCYTFGGIWRTFGVKILKVLSGYSG